MNCHKLSIGMKKKNAGLGKKMQDNVGFRFANLR